MCSTGESEQPGDAAPVESSFDDAATGPGDRFSPAFVGTGLSKDVVAAARELATTMVERLTDEECFGPIDDVELARRSLAAIGGAVLDEIAGRDLCDARFGMTPATWFERRHGRTRAAVASEARTARRLRTDLPDIRAALARGEISAERAALIAAKVNDRNAPAFTAAQGALLDLSASEPSFHQFRVLVDDLARYADPDGSEPEPTRSAVSVRRADQDVVVNGNLTGADGASFEQLLEAATNDLWRRWRADVQDHPDLEIPSRKELRAQALLELVRRGAGADPTAKGTVVELSLVVDADRIDQIDPILAGVLAGTGIARFADPDPGRHAGALHRHHPANDVDPTRCGCGGDSADRAVAFPVMTLDGAPVRFTAAQWELLACDPRIVELLVDRFGQPKAARELDRSPVPIMRSALIARDGGCAYPGCDCPAAWCDAHHVIEWSRDGRTVIVNLVLLCRRHHGIVHRKGWRVQAVTEPRPGDGHFTITTPSGHRMHTEHRRRRRAEPAA
jgi:hypothetical protein